MQEKGLSTLALSSKQMLSCSLILPVLSSHPFKASSHGGVLVTPFLFPSYFDKYSQKFYSLTRMMKPLYASFLRKFHSVDLGSPLGTMAFFLFFFFQLVLQMCSHLEPAGAVEVLLPFYLFPGHCLWKTVCLTFGTGFHFSLLTDH